MPESPYLVKSLRDLKKNCRGIHVDADYVYTWGGGYVPDGYSYPIDAVFIYDKHRSFELDGMLVGFGQDINCVTSTRDRILVGGGGSKDLTGYRYNVLRLYRKDTQLLEDDWGFDESRMSILHLDDAYVIAGTDDGELVLYDKDTLKTARSLFRYPSFSSGHNVCSDAMRIYAGTVDGAIITWDKDTFKPGMQFKGKGEKMIHLVVADGRLHAADMAGNINAWDARTGSILVSVPPDESNGVKGMAWHGNQLVTGNAAGEIFGWTFAAGSLSISWRVKTKAKDIQSMNADTMHVYTGHESGTVMVWDVAAARSKA